ncbi:MAG: outer membrane beta-barrel protein [Bacteroidia bacterium]
MRKWLFLLVLSLPLITNAQSFADGTNLVYIGFGLPPGTVMSNTNTFEPNFTDLNINNYGTGVLKYEHGFHKYFGLGLNLEYSGASISYKYGPNVNYTYVVTDKRSVIGGYARFNGHFPIGDKFDIHGGFGLGYLYTLDIAKDNNPNNTSANSPTNHNTHDLEFSYQITVGARLMVKNGFGIFAEFGYATTPAQLGVVLKF